MTDRRTDRQMSIARCYVTKFDAHKDDINKAVANFTKCLTAYMAVTADGGHFKHLQ